LNSAPAQLAIQGYIVLHPSPHVLEHIAIPRYEAKNEIHKKLAKLSEQCHSAAAQDNSANLATLEAQLDELAAQHWGITNGELHLIQTALPKIEDSELEADSDGDEE